MRCRRLLIRISAMARNLSCSLRKSLTSLLFGSERLLQHSLELTSDHENDHDTDRVEAHISTASFLPFPSNVISPRPSKADSGNRSWSDKLRRSPESYRAFERVERVGKRDDVGSVW